MTQAIEAIYENGHLRILNEVKFREGQRVRLNLEAEYDEVRAILGDLLEPRDAIPLEDSNELDNLDDEALLAIIREGSKAVSSTADAIIAEREEGP